jgi:hypothetical protein
MPNNGYRRLAFLQAGDLFRLGFPECVKIIDFSPDFAILVETNHAASSNDPVAINRDIIRIHSVLVCPKLGKRILGFAVFCRKTAR